MHHTYRDTEARRAQWSAVERFLLLVLAAIGVFYAIALPVLAFFGVDSCRI
jgi:hypothetical protein